MSVQDVLDFRPIALGRRNDPAGAHHRLADEGRHPVRAGPPPGEGQLALARLGVTVGDEVTTRDYLESGRLTIPFPIRLPAPDAYYLLQPADGVATPAIETFRAWLVGAAHEHRSWFATYWSTAERG